MFLIMIIELKGPIWFLSSESQSYWHIPILCFIHMLNKLAWETSNRNLLRDFLTPDKMVATAMKGVNVANWQISKNKPL